MKQSSDMVSPRSDPGKGRVASRRDILFATGLFASAAAADLCLGRAGSARQAASPLRESALTTTARPVWLAGPSSTPSDEDWLALQHKLSTDKLVRPGQRDYNTAKELFDPTYDRLRPAAIAYCGRPSDVAACLSFCTHFSMPLRVRSGGHSYEGWSALNNGLIIDVTAMDRLKVGTGNVTVGSGIRLIDFYSGLAAHGKAVPGGSCPTVGLAGLTLGGGIGVLARIYGLTCDNLESLDIVTADGSTLTCTPKNSHSDLFWASQGGGGGNFGVATSFTFKTHDLTSLYLFGYSWDWKYAARVVKAWQSWAPHAPDALWANMHLGANTGGAPGISAGGTYAGSAAALDRLLDQFQDLVGAPPTGQFVAPNTFLEAMLVEAGCENLNSCHLPPVGTVQRVPWFAKSDFFSKPLDTAGINVLLHGIEALTTVRGAEGGNGSISFDALGGAVNRVKPQATAFVHRDALWVSQYYTTWTWPGSAAGRTNQFNWMTSFYDSLHHTYANGQAYQNYVDADLKDWQREYYGINYPRLQEVKTTYDKKRLFDFPQVIQPLAT